MRRHYKEEFDRHIAQKLANHKIAPPAGGFAAVREQMWLRKWWKIGNYAGLLIIFLVLSTLYFEDQTPANHHTFLNSRSATKTFVSEGYLQTLSNFTEKNFSQNHKINAQEPEAKMTQVKNRVVNQNLTKTFTKTQGAFNAYKNPATDTKHQTVDNEIFVQDKNQEDPVSFEGDSQEGVASFGLETPKEVDALNFRDSLSRLATYYEHSDKALMPQQQEQQTDSTSIALPPTELLNAKKTVVQGFKFSTSTYCAFKHQTITSPEPMFSQKTALKDRVGLNWELTHLRKINTSWILRTSLGYSRLYQRTWVEVTPESPKALFLKNQDSISTWVRPSNTEWKAHTSQTDLLYLGLGVQYRLHGMDKWFLSSNVLLLYAFSSPIEPHAGLRMSVGRNLALGNGWAVSIEPEINYFLRSYTGGFLNSRPYSVGLRLGIIKFGSNSK